jgi:hypothetical protein
MELIARPARLLVLFAVAAVGLAACGAAKVTPNVATRVVQADRFLGLPLLSDIGNEVRTDPGLFSADSPELYTDPQSAITALRRDGFVAGITKIFKAPSRPEGAESIVVQMRDTKGASAEFARQLASAQTPACPGGEACTRRTRDFGVSGIPEAAGVQVTLRIRRQGASEHPDVLHSQAIIFRKGSFVYQLWLGAKGPTTGRADLIAAARALAAHG